MSDETTRIYPTHQRGNETLVVALPAVGPDSDELVITDAGLDVEATLAQQLIDFREASLTPVES